MNTSRIILCVFNIFRIPKFNINIVSILFDNFTELIMFFYNFLVFSLLDSKNKCFDGYHLVRFWTWYLLLPACDNNLSCFVICFNIVQCTCLLSWFLGSYFSVSFRSELNLFWLCFLFSSIILLPSPILLNELITLY